LQRGFLSDVSLVGLTNPEGGGEGQEETGRFQKVFHCVKKRGEGYGELKGLAEKNLATSPMHPQGVGEGLRGRASLMKRRSARVVENSQIRRERVEQPTFGAKQGGENSDSGEHFGQKELSLSQREGNDGPKHYCEECSEAPRDCSKNKN